MHGSCNTKRLRFWKIRSLVLSEHYVRHSKAKYQVPVTTDNGFCSVYVCKELHYTEMDSIGDFVCVNVGVLFTTVLNSFVFPFISYVRKKD